MTRSRKRLFLALWPDEATREAIVERTAQAVQKSGGRAVKKPNVHLTLAFLHNVDVALLPCIDDAARRVAKPPFSLTLTRIASWPRSGILWLGPDPRGDENDGAAHLATQLWTNLGNCGFVPERRPFRPHVTLARKTRVKIDQRVSEPIRWRVREFALMESTTAGKQPRYDVVQTFSLRNR